MSQEVDVATLRRLLADVSRKAEQAQAKVIATIETKHVEFVAASDRVGELRGNVEKLRGDVRKAVRLLSGGETTAGAEEAPLGKLHAAINEYSALKEEMAGLDVATTVLSTMLEVQRHFSDLDKLSSSADFPEAADITLEIAKALQSISAPDSSAEPGMVRAAKAQYYQRRGLLAQRIEDTLDGRLAFGDRSVSVRPGEIGAGALGPAAGLARVWQALQMLGLLDRKVERLAAELRVTVLSPLLEAARQSTPGRGPEARLSADRSSGAVSWAWVVGQDAGFSVAAAPLRKRPTDTQTPSQPGPPAQTVLPVLESLVAFIREHIADGSSSVTAALGKLLWPPLCTNLLRHFDVCEADGGAAVEHFELAMCSQGFIGSKEKAMSRQVNARRHALGEKRRSAVLAEVRAWLLQDNASLVQVSDAEEPGSVTQILSQMDTRGALGEGAGAEAEALLTAPQGTGGQFSEKLRHALRDDAGFLRIPSMQVSASVHKLGKRLRELADEMVGALGKGHVEGARDLNRLAREACALFSVLRPHVQKGQLKTNPQCCGLFFSDCLYLVHVLLMMPYCHGKLLPPEHQHLVLFVDLVPQIRRLGEHHFLAMLRYQQEKLADALKPCDFAAGIAQDRKYIAAEAALGAAVQQVKEAVQGLLGVLPAQLFSEVAGLLSGVLCQSLMGKLFQLQHLAPDEVGCLSSLLTSGLVGCRQIFSVVQARDGNSSAPKGDSAIGDSVPGWEALTLVADLLGSGFSRFMERRTQLQKVLKKEEVIKLMHLSWRDEFLSPDEAWAAMSNAP